MNDAFLERFFHLSERKTSPRTEITAGVTTFMTMAYIVFVNPDILSAAGVPRQGAATATCLAAGLITLLMGLWTNWPLALASGMGLNAFVAFGLVLGKGMTWQAAMGVVFIEGALILLLVLAGVREAVMEAIPADLRRAIAGGIGFFIAFIGLKNAGIVVQNEATLLTFGTFDRPEILLALFGLTLTIVLLELRVAGAMLFGIAAVTAVSAGMGLTKFQGFVGAPSFETFGRIDLKGALSLGAASAAAIFSFMMVDFFDTLGTVTGLGQQAGLTTKDGRIPGIRRVLIVDSLGAVAGGFTGASSVTSYIESAAGIGTGGRTGLTAVVAGMLFLGAMFFSPLVAVVPACATAPALVLAGYFMMSPLKSIDFNDVVAGVSAFVILIVTPLTFSIAHGIGYGFIVYTVGSALTGRARKAHPLMYAASALFAVNFAIEAMGR